MNSTRIRLFCADLHYPDDLGIHTAASGRVGSLHELYLVVERANGWRGIGEVRANIDYLSHMPTEAVAPAIHDLVVRLPWEAPVEELFSILDGASDAPALSRAAVDSALVDGEARNRGISVSRLLGGGPHTAQPTNHCLFWGPDDRFARLAERYVSEGFRKLKVRIAVGPIERDLERLRWLRARFGGTIEIAVDANGSWTGAEAVENLALFAEFDLAYVEQPTTPGDWDAFRFALARSPVPLMLDEGLARVADVTRLAEIGAPAMGHLKIVKFGGPRAVCAAARELQAAGVGIMIGQMNEGALATALAAQCTSAVEPKHAELYGCYGLLDDVVAGVTYADGAVTTPAGPGLGLALDEQRCTLLWDLRLP